MKSRVAVFGSVLVTGIIVGLLVGARMDIFSPAKSESATAPVVSSRGSSIEDAVINVANTTGKAVVSISTERTTKVQGARRFYFNAPFGQDDPFRGFFEDFFGDMPEREFKQTGLGSGVIIDAQGYILTNEHVINGADKITVTLPDGREFKGEVKGRDMRSDLAIIKINAQSLPVAELGDSDNLKIGQWVVAIGNPFGFALDNPEPTVTVGVVSALHRSLGRAVARQKDYGDLIQTDAAINPGNSGGPLVNLKGEIVGINVAIFSTTGGYQGVGFAIPVNNAKRIIARLIEGKKILYGWLGITVQDLSDDLAGHFGIPDKNGVLVAKVLEDGPAQKAQIKDADVIRKIDGNPVNNVKELLSIIGKAEVGKSIKLTVIRDKKELTFNVVIGERPQESQDEPGISGEPGHSQTWRGLQVEDLTSDSAGALRRDVQSGVLVVDVQPGSAADEAGIVTRDVITEINKQPVKSVLDYKKITGASKGDCLIKTTRGYFLVKEK